MPLRQLCLFIIAFFLCTSSIIAQSDYLSVDALQGLVGLSSPDLSPDGNKVVFITSRADFETNSYTRQLMEIDLRSKKQRLLSTREGVGQPTWSPDGRHLAFLASGEEGRQIYLLPADGGEASRVTRSGGSIRRFAWSPDGTRLAFIADQVVKEKTGEDRFNQSFEVGSDDFLTTSPSVPKQVWITDRWGQESRQLTASEVTVGTDLSTSNLEWSPDGTQLSFTVFPSPAPGDTDLGRVVLCQVDSGKMTWLTQHEMRESGSRFIPSTSQMAYQYPREGVPSNLREIYLTEPGSGTSQSWTRALDRHVQSFGFLQDGSALILASNGLKSGMWHSPAPGVFVPLPLGDIVSVGAYDHSSSGAIALVGTQVDRPAELYFKSSPEEAPVQLTSFNDAIAQIKLGTSSPFEWESTDGLRPNGVLTYPPHFDPEEKYPLVLLIHGGPTASSKLNFSPRAQLMAAKGWIVFQPNYRGSENLGNAFQSAIANDAAEGPGEDVFTGVEELLKRQYVDGERLAVSGWSYGGWMTSWLIGRYPDLWTAAVAGAAPVDYTDMYSLNDLNRMRRHAITESPYVGNNLEKAYAQSPITHFSKLTTPTLIMSVTGDYRVTITGSYKLYGALRDNQVPVQFIAYPGRGHFPSDPVQRQDVMVRWIGWLDAYLKEGPVSLGLQQR